MTDQQSLSVKGRGWDPDGVGYGGNRNRIMRIEVRYQTPYGDCEWRSQWFNTLAEAERMVDFYKSCGSPSHIAPSSLAQFAHLR